jgi:hypothetical protein
LSLIASILPWVTPALATALKSMDARLIFNFSPNIFESEPAYLIIMGAGMLALASFTRRKIKS